MNYDVFLLDEKPYCIRHRYKRMLSEGVPTGSVVLKIEARDADLNPKLRYYLTGHGAEHFSLDIDNGNFQIYIVLLFNKMNLLDIKLICSLLLKHEKLFTF